jgi:signal transduction histidine kinase
VETSIFRVVQEAVTNIVRHAEAKTARIQLEHEDERVSVLIEDDGRGFDLRQVLNSPDRARALGLLGMEERISLLGGTLSVESAPGEGTRVRAEIPLEEEDQP